MKLKRYAYAPIAALAVWTLLLAVLPAMANAEETSQRNEPQRSNRDAHAADYVVVAPGDSLWSISERQLGPSATPRQIASGTERIYALNQDQIGADPNTIYVGQKLVLPSAVERHVPPQVSEPATAAPARGTAAAVKVTPTSREAMSGPDRASRQMAEESEGRTAKVPVAAVQRRSLPDVAAVAPVPVVRSLAADGTLRSPIAYLSGIRAMVSSAASALVETVVTDDRYAGRQLFGAALILMSLSIGAFPLVRAMIRAARRAMVRRERRKSLYRSARVAYVAAPFVGFGNAHAEESVEAPRSAPSEERERPPDSANSRNLSGALEDVRRDSRVALIANSKRVRLRRARRRGPARRLPRGTKVPGALQVQAPGYQRQRVNRRPTMVGANPKVPDARWGWDISESLRRSIESLPLLPGAPMDAALAELRPQVVGELRSVALLERRRRLSNRENHQASALRNLLALAGEDNPNDGRRV